MTQVILERSVVDSDLLALLRAGTGKTVYDGHVPPNEAPPTEQPDPDKPPTGAPYAILYCIPGGGFDGPWGNGAADATFAYQVTCVGYSRAQAQWMADLVRRVLLLRRDRTALNEGWVSPWPPNTAADPPMPYKCVGRVQSGTPGGAEPSSTEEAHPIFTVADVYHVTLTPLP